jgi:hypothetical protein
MKVKEIKADASQTLKASSMSICKNQSLITDREPNQKKPSQQNFQHSLNKTNRS